jgi:penicillin-insensitive murein DD-endopeptidase
MHQPSDSQSHMDHYHIRIYCSLADRRMGCIDRGPERWFKKDLKYTDEPPRKVEVPPALANLKLNPVPLF